MDFLLGLHSQPDPVRMAGGAIWRKKDPWSLDAHSVRQHYAHPTGLTHALLSPHITTRSRGRRSGKL